MASIGPLIDNDPLYPSVIPAGDEDFSALWLCWPRAWEFVDPIFR